MAGSSPARRSSVMYVISVAVAAIAIVGVWIAGRGLVSNDATDVDGQYRVQRDISQQLPHGESSSRSQSASLDKSGLIRNEGDTSTNSIASVSDSGEVSGPYNPISLPAEFAGLAEQDDKLGEFHRMLEHEAEDTEWAMGLERELENLISESLDSSTVTVSLLECRSKSCEILANGYGHQAFEDWMHMATDLFSSGMLDEWGAASEAGPFSGGCGASEPQPGIFRLNCQLTLIGQQAPDSDETTDFSLSAPYPDGVDYERVTVTDDFSQLIESNSDFYEFHRALEMESTDHGWSSFIEAQLMELFAANPELQSLEFVHVECRMTRCEALMTVDEFAVAAWVVELHGFDDLPWHDLTFTVHSGEIQDGQMGIVWLLQRQIDD